MGCLRPLTTPGTLATIFVVSLLSEMGEADLQAGYVHAGGSIGPLCTGSDLSGHTHVTLSMRLGCRNLFVNTTHQCPCIYTVPRFIDSVMGRRTPSYQPQLSNRGTCDQLNCSRCAETLFYGYSCASENNAVSICDDVAPRRFSVGYLIPEDCEGSRKTYECVVSTTDAQGFDLVILRSELGPRSSLLIATGSGLKAVPRQAVYHPHTQYPSSLNLKGLSQAVITFVGSDQDDFMLYYRGSVEVKCNDASTKMKLSTQIGVICGVIGGVIVFIVVIGVAVLCTRRRGNRTLRRRSDLSFNNNNISPISTMEFSERGVSNNGYEDFRKPDIGKCDSRQKEQLGEDEVPCSVL